MATEAQARPAAMPYKLARRIPARAPFALVPPAAPRRPGRPPKAAQERKSEYVKVRVTPDIIDALYCLALREGKSLSALIRDRLAELLCGPNK